MKSQIVSVGVLGTFVGIFIGLQAFNPDDIINSVNEILVGLKTAFFTSIVGMSVSTILSIFQKFKSKSQDE
ncbi:MAG: MotA/TolQ/ExbB proton channel family protein [Campylobacterota bacterium]|nr:MotA/TolQ/ExbB proton channel family protein [Campylobacterota bacterium]